jgi:hypothetical protein
MTINRIYEFILNKKTTKIGGSQILYAFFRRINFQLMPLLLRLKQHQLGFCRYAHR